VLRLARPTLEHVHCTCSYCAPFSASSIRTVRTYVLPSKPRRTIPVILFHLLRLAFTRPRFKAVWASGVARLQWRPPLIAGLLLRFSSVKMSCRPSHGSHRRYLADILHRRVTPLLVARPAWVSFQARLLRRLAWPQICFSRQEAHLYGFDRPFGPPDKCPSCSNQCSSMRNSE